MVTRLRKRKQGTATSAFGAPGRSSHDSSAFYNTRMYKGLGTEDTTGYEESEIPPENLNRIYCKSSEAMSELPDSSIHLMITSPPYNVTKEYDDDLSLGEYLDLLGSVWQETYRVLVPGGRACINVANLGRKPYIPLHGYIIEAMVKIGYLMRGEIIWNKGSSAGSSTAWGSWQSAANPVLRDVHEYILVFSKGSFSREKAGRESTIEKEAFLEWTRSVWDFPAVSANKIGHPAPFPEELPRRLIQLYSFRDDVVLDPFAGSGTVCLAALNNCRNYVAYEIDPEYARLAETRISAYRNQTDCSG